METMMQQTFQPEDTESYKSSSSHSNNEDNAELNVDKSLEVESSSKCIQGNVQPPQESSGNLTNVDLDTMMQNYKQLGGELELSLKILENKRLSLNKTLTEVRHECDILNQQKECQKKNLVDLQIRLENLSTEQMSIWKENEKDKLEKTERIKQEMESVLANNAYITSTYSKFNEILMAEKKKNENFFCFSKNKCESRKKQGECYIIEVRKIKNSFKADYKVLLKQESKIIKELNTIVLEYRSVMESRNSLLKKINVIKKELDASERDGDVLKAIISQKNEKLKESQKKFRNFKDTQTSLLDKIDKEIFNFKTSCQKNTAEAGEMNRILNETKLNLQFVIDENCTLDKELIYHEDKNKSDNQELNRLVDECSSLKTELSDVETEQEKLESESECLPELIGQFNQLELKGNELSNSIETITVEVNLLEAEVALKQTEFENIQLALAMSKLELVKSNLAEAKADECNADIILQEHRVNSEKNLLEKEKELDEVICEIVENETTVDKLENEIENMDSNISLIKNETEAAVIRSAEIEEEELCLQHKEEEFNTLNSEVLIIEEEIVTTNDEFKTEKGEADSNQNIEELELNLKNTILKVEEATNYYENQIETIKTSFKNQEKTCKEKATREIGEVEKKTRKEEAHEKRVSLAVPRLHIEMIKFEKELKNLLPDLSKEIKMGLDMLDELASFYKQLFDSKKQKGKAMIIRNLSSIEEQLASPMKCMMTLDYIPRINLNPPTSNGYHQVLKVFREKYTEVVKQLETTQTLEMANKLQEMGSCLFGKKYVKPSINQQVMNDTEISSSTEVNY